MKDKIVIANASGFWGDEAAAIKRQVKGGPIDYLTFDYLAEITMIILTRQQAKDPQAGYARDFAAAMDGILEDIVEKGITVISNAGGVNPSGCARALEEKIREKGLDLPIAVVHGDNLTGSVSELMADGCDFRHQVSGRSMKEISDRVISANAYIGAQPIVDALDKGARIVITGRTYDAAGVLAPMIHEFKWDWKDYDKLAAGLLAGHMIECGTQSTGGNYTFWREVPSYENMGFPLVEVEPAGSFVLTKHPDTGGLVNVRTVKEQVLYEIGNPREYICPDVIADFTSFEMKEDGNDRVRVSGVTGRAPTNNLKVSVTYESGHKITAMLVVSGPEAVDKARKFSEMFWSRVGEEGLAEKRTDFVGHSACWGESAAPPSDPNEIILRFAARAEDKKPLIRMSKEIAGLILAGPPGVTVFGGRPPVAPAFGFWPALIEKDKVIPKMDFQGKESTFTWDAIEESSESDLSEPPAPDSSGQGEMIGVPLARIAHARSGDKGDLCNIGVAALKPEFYPEILRELTEERIAAFFKSNVRGPVKRYRLDNLNAVNFLLDGALDGGGTVSLLIDNQGKTLSQALLTMKINVHKNLID